MEPERRDPEGVDPTVRWLMRGVWKILLVVFVLFVVGAVVQVVR